MTLSNLEWLGKIFNDMKRRAVLSATAELLVEYRSSWLALLHAARTQCLLALGGRVLTLGHDWVRRRRPTLDPSASHLDAGHFHQQLVSSMPVYTVTNVNRLGYKHYCRTYMRVFMLMLFCTVFIVLWVLLIQINWLIDWLIQWFIDKSFASGRAVLWHNHIVSTLLQVHTHTCAA